MKQLLYAAIALTALTAATSRAEGPYTLRVAYYSNSQLKDGAFCENAKEDKVALKDSRGDRSFSKNAMDPNDPKAMPNFVALHRKYNALGCTVKFTSGPLAGQTATVRDLNPVDTTIDFPLNTSSAADRFECNNMIKNGAWIKKSPKVTFDMTCPQKNPSSSATGGTLPPTTGTPEH